jgi:hypothetical protein
VFNLTSASGLVCPILKLQLGKDENYMKGIKASLNSLTSLIEISRNIITCKLTFCYLCHLTNGFLSRFKMQFTAYITTMIIFATGVLAVPQSTNPCASLPPVTCSGGVKPTCCDGVRVRTILLITDLELTSPDETGCFLLLWRCLPSLIHSIRVTGER